MPSIQPYRGSFLIPDLAHATVADVMRPGFLSCPPETPLGDVARIMATHRVHSVVIAGVETDAVHGGHLVWKLISDTDLARAVSQSNERQTAADVATTEAVTVAPTEPLRSAARLIAEHRTSHLVVSSETTRTPVGILSTLDLAAAVAWGGTATTPPPAGH